MVWVEITFKPEGKRYAYSYDGPERIEPGVDRVEIETRDGLFVYRVQGVLYSRPDTNGRNIRPIVRLMPRSQRA